MSRWRECLKHGQLTARLRLVAALACLFSATLINAPPLAAQATKTAQAATPTIIIGVSGPLSGRYGYRGRAMARGAQLAVGDINRAGGLTLGGRKLTLKLQIIDDKCDVSSARDAAMALTRAKVALVIGHGCARASIAAAKLYAKAGVLQIDPLTRHRRFNNPRTGPGIFRLAGRDDLQGKVAGAYLAALPRSSRIAIVHDRTLFTMAQAAGAQTILKQQGVTSIYRTTLRPGEKDYSRLVARLAASKAQIIYITSYATETGILTRQFFDAGHKAQFLASDIMRAPEYLSIAGTAGARTLLTLRPRARDFPRAAAVLKRLRQFKLARPMAALKAYAAVQIWATAARRSHSVQMPKLAAILSGQTFQTILGDIWFDRQGNSNLPSYRVYRKIGARYEPVDQ